MHGQPNVENLSRILEQEESDKAIVHRLSAFENEKNSILTDFC